MKKSFCVNGKYKWKYKTIAIYVICYYNMCSVFQVVWVWYCVWRNSNPVDTNWIGFQQIKVDSITKWKYWSAFNSPNEKDFFKTTEMKWKFNYSWMSFNHIINIQPTKNPSSIQFSWLFPFKWISLIFFHSTTLTVPIQSSLKSSLRHCGNTFSSIYTQKRRKKKQNIHICNEQFP